MKKLTLEKRQLNLFNISTKIVKNENQKEQNKRNSQIQMSSRNITIKTLINHQKIRAIKRKLFKKTKKVMGLIAQMPQMVSKRLKFYQKHALENNQ